MNKVIKITVSVAIALSVALSPLASISISAFGIGAFMTWVTDCAAPILASFIAGGAAGSLFSSEQSAEHYLGVIEGAIMHSDGIGFNTENNSFYVENPAYLTDEELEFANFFVDTMNQHTFLNNFFSVKNYEAVKGHVNKLFSDYLYAKAMQEKAFEADQDSAQGFIDIINSGILPDVDWSFVGPKPSVMFPSQSATSEFSADGFIFTPPVTLNSDGYFSSEAAAKAAGCTDITKWADNKYSGGFDWSGYGGSRYIIYDNTVFFKVHTTYSGNFYENYAGSPCGDSLNNLKLYKSVDGKCLGDYGITSWSQFRIGYCYNVTGAVASAFPTLTTIDEDDYTTTTGGGTVELPRTDAEDIIGDALGVGLITGDSILDFTEDGEIAGADGISLAKLQEICDLIAEGSLQFEDVQEYLDLITKLVGAGNLTASEQRILLDNLAELTKTQAGDVAAIKEAIESLTKVGDIEVTVPELDDISITSGGLDEASELIDIALPIVGQSINLIDNLFNQAEAAPDYIPNFNFYWDSNGDGAPEKYTFFDLSFMENTLTNNNLEDKNRFANPMTIREFIQSLIVLIVYVTFAIKILKRLPGLLGGVESSDNSQISGQMHF